MVLLIVVKSWILEPDCFRSNPMLTSCMVLDKSLSLSVLQFIHLKMVIKITLSSEFLGELSMTLYCQGKSLLMLSPHYFVSSLLLKRVNSLLE
jgi:hypothetical protein